MQCFPTTFLPCLLTAEQKQKRLEVSQDLYDHTNNDEIKKKKILRGDETWSQKRHPDSKKKKRGKLGQM